MNHCTFLNSIFFLNQQLYHPNTFIILPSETVSQTAHNATDLIVKNHHKTLRQKTVQALLSIRATVRGQTRTTIKKNSRTKKLKCCQ